MGKHAGADNGVSVIANKKAIPKLTIPQHRDQSFEEAEQCFIYDLLTGVYSVVIELQAGADLTVG
jgi:hypothetical protein